MWMSWMVSAILACALIFIPGLCVLKSARLPFSWAIASAPLVSVACICLIGETFAALHIPLSSIVYLAVLVGLTCALSVFMRLYSASQENNAQTVLWTARPHIPRRYVLLYVACGCVMGTVFFLIPAQHPESIAHGWDVVAHLDFTQAMIEGGKYSSLNPSFYSEAAQAINPSTSSFGFYPSAWNTVCALCAQFGCVSVPIAANACNFVFTSVVFPLAVLSFIAQVFEGKREVMLGGCVLSGISCVFPWTLLVYGPLFPFVAACSMMPSIFWVFMQITRSQTPKQELVVLGVLFVLGGVSLVLMHTSSFFACVVMLTPWCAARIAHTKRTMSIIRSAKDKRSLAILFVVSVIALWGAIYLILVVAKHALNFWWASYATIPEALLQLVFFEFVGTRVVGSWFVGPQPILTLLFVLGAVRACHIKQGRFLIVSFAYLAFLCVLMISFDGDIKGFLGSFWYTDPYRIASLAYISALPLIALGLSSVVVWARKKISDMLLCRFSTTSSNAGLYAYTGASMVCVLLLCAHALLPFELTQEHDSGSADNKPSSTSQMPITLLSAPATNFKVIMMGANDDRFLDASKRAFLQRAHTITRNDVVLNNPFDGSALAYGMYGMQTFWRYPYTLGDAEKFGFARVRIEAYRVASSLEVQRVMDRISARYVLSLGECGADHGVLSEEYLPQMFYGIDRITPETPGFRVVLEDGSMRLYEIDRSAWNTAEM